MSEHEPIEGRFDAEPTDLQQKPDQGEAIATPNSGSESNEEKIEDVRKNIEKEENRGLQIEDSGNRDYEIEGNIISVMWKVFWPENEEGGEDKKYDGKGIVFFPGWSSSESARSTEPLSTEMAKFGKKPVISIDTRAEKVIADSLYLEARAVHAFLKEIALKNVTLSGHSQGGLEAANLAVILQKEDADLDVNGLIMMDAVGIHKQGKFELAWKFLLDGGLSIFGKKKKEATLAYEDVGEGVLAEIKKSGIEYPKRFLQEVSEMAQENPKLAEIACPVILIQGKRDMISSADKIGWSDASKLEEGSGMPDNYNNSPFGPALRGIFEKSPFVRWVLASKEPHHPSPLQRSESYADAGLFLLERYWREKEKK